MPPVGDKELPPLVLVCGLDDFTVRRRAKEIFDRWSTELGGSDHETIDGGVTRVSEALLAIRKLREALNTLPFFGSGKAIWLQNCTFLGTDRTSESQTVTEAVASLAQELKTLDWKGVRLLISADKVDKRKAFYKTIDKLGAVEVHEGWSIDDKGWADQAELWAEKALATRNKTAETDALAELVTRIGPNPRQLETEVEKLSLFVADRSRITLDDVKEVCSRNKTSRAFALGEALAARDLRQLLRCLDEELWEVKLDSQRSEVGLLYGLISKVRSMLLLKEMTREGWIKAEMDYARFKAALTRVPVDQFPTDKRFNPMSMHPYMLHKALPQTKNYTSEELIQAMDILLECNLALVSSSVDDAIALQQALVRIASSPGSK